MNKIHNGIIDVVKRNSLKDSGLNNFDLGTTKMYRGVKPMFEQLVSQVQTLIIQVNKFIGII